MLPIRMLSISVAPGQGTDQTSEKLLAAVENRATKIQQASHILSVSVGGGMLATVGRTVW